MMEINLSGLRFFSRIGVFQQEQTVGGEFEVGVSVRYSPKLPVEDVLEDTISYADIYEEIKAEMAVPHQLLEHVAYRISVRLTERWQQIESGFVEVKKLHAPIKGLIGECGVKYFFEK